MPETPETPTEELSVICAVLGGTNQSGFAGPLSNMKEKNSYNTNTSDINQKKTQLPATYKSEQTQMY